MTLNVLSKFDCYKRNTKVTNIYKVYKVREKKLCVYNAGFFRFNRPYTITFNFFNIFNDIIYKHLKKTFNLFHLQRNVFSSHNDMHKNLKL